MKNTLRTSLRRLAALAALAMASTFGSQFSTAHAQGSLTPPAGAPAPVMKSLDEIEARTPITNRTSQVTISQPGSYYLTGNLTVSSGDAIVILTNFVTLDLNGFTISSTAPSASGFAVKLAAANGNTHVTVMNGYIKSGVTNNGSGVLNGPGFASGIDMPGASAPHCRVTGVSVSGVLNFGIFLGTDNSSSVESCKVSASIVSTGYGITADNVSRCSVRDAVGYGIVGVTVTDSSVTLANISSGVRAIQSDGLVQNCSGTAAASATAIHVPNGAAIGCYAKSTGGIAITAHIGNSCVIATGATNITYKYNMP